MTAVDDILGGLPLDQIAAQVGTDPASVETAAASVLPALLGGLHANAQDGAGAASIASALAKHPPAGAENISLSDVDTTDGAKIAQHIFGGQQDQVVQQLGGLSGSSSSLVQKLIPILAPIVLSYLSKQIVGKGSSGGSVVTDILGELLTGATQGSTPRGGVDAGSIVGDLLGGLLGGGRR